MCKKANRTMKEETSEKLFSSFYRHLLKPRILIRIFINRKLSIRAHHADKTKFKSCSVIKKDRQG